VRACLEEAGAQRCEATDRNRIEGRAGRGELAHDSEAQRYDRYGKCGACALNHRVLTWGDLSDVAMSNRTVDPERTELEHQGPGAAASCPPPASEQPTNGDDGIARREEILVVIRQKSAEAIVVATRLTRTVRRRAEHEEKGGAVANSIWTSNPTG
jgi:hypothetical protein